MEKTFKEFKNDVIKTIKICVVPPDLFDKIEKARTTRRIMDIMKGDFEIFCEPNFFTALYYTHKERFNKIGIFYNEENDGKDENEYVFVDSNSKFICIGRKATAFVDGFAEIKALDQSLIFAKGNDRIMARGNSTINAFDNVEVEAANKSKVFATANVKVRDSQEVEVCASDRVIVHAYGHARIHARKTTYVTAHDDTTVISRDNSIVVAKKNSIVLAEGNSIVYVYDNARVIEAKDESYIIAHNRYIPPLQDDVICMHKKYGKIYYSDFQIKMNLQGNE